MNKILEVNINPISQYKQIQKLSNLLLEKDIAEELVALLALEIGAKFYLQEININRKHT